MRVLDQKTKDAVQAVINAHAAQLNAIPGFVAAEPGFPIIDGRVHKEPAIIIHLVQKKPPASVLIEDRAPRQLGPYRVSVMQADPLQQVTTLMRDQPIAAGRLSGEQVGSLRSLEMKLGGDVVLVAYAKPWRRHNRSRR